MTFSICHVCSHFIDLIGCYLAVAIFVLHLIQPSTCRRQMVVNSVDVCPLKWCLILKGHYEYEKFHQKWRQSDDSLTDLERSIRLRRINNDDIISLEFLFLFFSVVEKGVSRFEWLHLSVFFPVAVWQTHFIQQQEYQVLDPSFIISYVTFTMICTYYWSGRILDMIV